METNSGEQNPVVAIQPEFNCLGDSAGQHYESVILPKYLL